MNEQLLKDILISNDVLDKLGFSEYWDNDGDSGDRHLHLNERYTIEDFDARDEDVDYGYYVLEKSPQRFAFKSKDWKHLDNLYDFYIELSEQDKEQFLKLCDQKLKL